MLNSQTCPIDHTQFKSKTISINNINQKPITQTPDGTWHIHDYSIVRKILRSSVRQAGFASEQVGGTALITNQPILYLDGPTHTQQRKQTAKFFTPKSTKAYRQLMIEYADEMINKLKATSQADLSDLTMELAVLVAGQILGLPQNDIPRLAKRISRIVEDDSAESNWKAIQIYNNIKAQIRLFNFYWNDVRPAIQERRQNPKEDVISHIIGLGYTNTEILTECLTFGAAGMATTREFICAAFLHLMEDDTLRQRYLSSEEESERYAILHEILRLEPVVSNLYRRAKETITIEELNVTIPANALIDLHIYGANTDTTAVGEEPYTLCPHRNMAPRVPEPVMSFGDGNHRCPGAYVAIQETDIFLQRLLRLPTLHIQKQPTIKQNNLLKSYEIRQLIIAV